MKIQAFIDHITLLLSGMPKSENDFLAAFEGYAEEKINHHLKALLKKEGDRALMPADIKDIIEVHKKLFLAISPDYFSNSRFAALSKILADELKQIDPTLNYYQLLFPTLKVLDYSDDYSINLAEQHEANKLPFPLEDCALSDNDIALIKVSNCLKEATAEWTANPDKPEDTLFTHGYLGDDGVPKYLTVNERNRVINHSKQSQAYWKAVKKLHKLKVAPSQDESVGTVLLRLCKALYEGGVQGAGKEGGGTEEEMGDKGAQGILEFKSWYDTLTAVDREKIDKIKTRDIRQIYKGHLGGDGYDLKPLSAVPRDIQGKLCPKVSILYLDSEGHYASDRTGDREDLSLLAWHDRDPIAPEPLPTYTAIDPTLDVKERQKEERRRKQEANDWQKKKDFFEAIQKAKANVASKFEAIKLKKCTLNDVIQDPEFKQDALKILFRRKHLQPTLLKILLDPEFEQNTADLTTCIDGIGQDIRGIVASYENTDKDLSNWYFKPEGVKQALAKVEKLQDEEARVKLAQDELDNALKQGKLNYLQQVTPAFRTRVRALLEDFKYKPPARKVINSVRHLSLNNPEDILALINLMGGNVSVVPDVDEDLEAAIAASLADAEEQRRALAARIEVPLIPVEPQVPVIPAPVIPPAPMPPEPAPPEPPVSVTPSVPVEPQQPEKPKKPRLSSTAFMVGAAISLSIACIVSFSVGGPLWLGIVCGSLAIAFVTAAIGKFYRQTKQRVKNTVQTELNRAAIPPALDAHAPTPLPNLTPENEAPKKGDTSEGSRPHRRKTL